MTVFALLVGGETAFQYIAKDKAARTGSFFLCMPVDKDQPHFEMKALDACKIMWPKPDVLLIGAVDCLNGGLDFIEKYRALDGTKDTLIFAYSRNNLLSEWQKLKAIGANSYIPTTANSLEVTLNTVFGQDRKQAA